MDGITIKIILVCIIVALIVIAFIWSINRTKDTQTLDTKETSINVNIKDDSYWEKRFNGLKADYEDRENYHQEKYQQQKTEYEGREQFLRTMLDDSRNDYKELKTAYNEMQETSIKLQEQLQKANQMLFEYEKKYKNLETQLATLNDAGDGSIT